MTTSDTMPPALQAGWPSRLKVSGLVLVLVNPVPVYGVLALGWDVFSIVLLFWLENVVVGVLNALRLLVVRSQEGASWAAKIFPVPFFCVHYGLFTIFGGVGPGGGGGPFGLADTTRETISVWGIGIPLLLLTASHVFSFVWTFVLGGRVPSIHAPGDHVPAVRPDRRSAPRDPLRRLLCDVVGLARVGPAPLDRPEDRPGREGASPHASPRRRAAAQTTAETGER